MKSNIVNIAISPTGIGGTETFSRILNSLYPNSKTYSYRSVNDKTFNADFHIIKRKLIKAFISKITNHIYPVYNTFNYNFITNNSIVIINAPCDFDRIPFKVLKKSKVILLLHNEPNHIWNHSNYFGSNRENRLKALKYIDKIVTLSVEYIPRFSELFSLPHNKFSHVGHTVELDPVQAYKSTLHKTIITICRIDNKQKRLDRFVEVAKKVPNYEFKIYGFGPDVELIKSFIKDVHNVTFMGKTNDIVSVHRNTGIFLMTSDNEGLSIAVLESISQSTPVIIAKNSFAMAKKIIKNNYNGFVLEDFSINETVDKIRLIEQNYKEYSQNARISFSKFNKENFKNEWDTIFKKI